MSKYIELDFAKLDIDRVKRRGYSEAVFCECKTEEQLTKIFEKFYEAGSNVLGTRANKIQAKVLQEKFGDKIKYDETSKVVTLIQNEIKKIGGSGRIHGCIIDIDYYNHVYVNPIDMTVRSYWAFDTINKLIFPNVPALLKAECPTLYDNYLKLTEGEEYNPLMVRQTNDEITLLPQEYLETDIYNVSREIKKMQKLNSNILTTWYDVIPERNALPYRK